MFPLNDLNFVATALATFSAAVGYNVSRRRGRTASSNLAENERTGGRGPLRFLKFHRRNSTGAASARSASVALSEASDSTTSEPAASNCGTPVSVGLESFSDDVEDGSLKRKRSQTPRAMTDMPASKRRRTPPPEEEAVVKVEETTLQLPLPEEVAPEEKVAFSMEATASEALPEVTVLPRPITPPASPKSLPVAALPVQPSTPACPWHRVTPFAAAKPSSAFDAFSGQPSAFTNSSSADSPKLPVWSTYGRDLGHSSDDTPASASLDPLAALSHVANTHKVLTGEEAEDTEAELKGVKVFIKRGSRDFCEGILGNVKLLKHKVSGEERILFRREPVWKVTMSVRLRPTARCTFDEAQGALRVTLKELVAETQQEQLVIYALRRGKASRTDFADFAKAVVESARLQVQQPPA